MDELDETVEIAEASRISSALLTLISARDEPGLKRYLDQANVQQYDSTWCSCVGLLMNLRDSRPDDFDWLGWVVSGYPAYRRIVNDYFLYLYDRRHGNLRNVIPLSFFREKPTQ